MKTCHPQTKIAIVADVHKSTINRTIGRGNRADRPGDAHDRPDPQNRDYGANLLVGEGQPYRRLESNPVRALYGHSSNFQDENTSLKPVVAGFVVDKDMLQNMLTKNLKLPPKRPIVTYPLGTLPGQRTVGVSEAQADPGNAPVSESPGSPHGPASTVVGTESETSAIWLS
ncbi:MAG: hypothetical protein H0X47_20965 [Nitrospirales bacterium]|nr:hypothetical protein [Nitrospirales bacterium]